ncbi:MAG: YicC/YloC family endoribonuclease [Pseudomonadota bacterium]
MTAFSSRTGEFQGFRWSWEIRGVNARGLDIRLRLPDAVPGVETALRAAISAAVSRGNITVSLRLSRSETEGRLVIDDAQLNAVLDALDHVQDRAFEKGVTLGQPTAADVLAQRGVLTMTAQQDDGGALATALIADFAPLLQDFLAMRTDEGAALQDIIAAQVDQIAALVADAANAAADRAPKVQSALSDALARVVQDVSSVEPDRIAQELALIAVKSDVTEEIDRLQAHVAAARALIGHDGPIGRKLDFLSQEFNREANTLCAKSQDKALTAIGLSLKAVIDQMREQIQNVE